MAMENFVHELVAIKIVAPENKYSAMAAAS